VYEEYLNPQFFSASLEQTEKREKQTRITVWESGYKREDRQNFSFVLTSSAGNWFNNCYEINGLNK